MPEPICGAWNCNVHGRPLTFAVRCPQAQPRRYISVDTGRAWHILARVEDGGPDAPDHMVAVCGARMKISMLTPGWPKNIDMAEMIRLYPSGVVHRQCSDEAPL